MRRALLAAALVVASLAAPPASAEQVMLKQVAQPASYHPAGHAIDVLGITPGMSPDAVREILTKQYGSVNETKENLGLQYRGIDVATQNYITQMTGQKGADETDVWFATPTTGNAVVEVTRQVSYINVADAPTLAEVRKTLADKYGPPGFAGPAVGTGEIELMAWSYKGDKPSECAHSSCRADLADGLTVIDMARYQRAVQSGHELTIIGMLLAGIGDPNRVSSVVTTVSDAATKLQTLDAAIKQMQVAASPPAKPAGRSRR